MPIINAISCVVFAICNAAFVACVVMHTDDAAADGARQMGRVDHDR